MTLLNSPAAEPKRSGTTSLTTGVPDCSDTHNLPTNTEQWSW